MYHSVRPNREEEKHEADDYVGAAILAATRGGSGDRIFGAAEAGRGARPPGAQAPRFEVDPMWPKPLPNHWVIGSVIGVAVDASDHIWIIHREGSLEAKEQIPHGESAGRRIAALPRLRFWSSMRPAT